MFRSIKATASRLSMQQPLMEKLYPETRSFGDVVLDLLKKAKPDSYKAFPDYYAYLKSAIVNAKPAFHSQARDEEFWEDTLSAGVLRRPAALLPLPAMDVNPEMIRQPGPRSADAKYPFHLIPAVSAEHARWPARESILAAGVPGHLDHRGLGQLG